MRVVGEGGLVSQGSLEEPVGGVGLAGTTDLAAPEAAELGRMDCITGHGYVYHVRACEDRGRKCWCEAEDLAAPLEDSFVQYL